MRIGGSKKKGNSFETKIARVLSKWYYGEDNVLVRNGNSGSMSTFRNHEVPGGDIIQIKMDFPEFPYSVELKHHKDFDIEKLMFSSKSKEIKAWQQCTNDAIKLGKIPLLIFRKNYGEIFATVNKILIGTLSHEKYLEFRGGATYCKTNRLLILPLDTFLIHFKGANHGPTV